MGCRWLLAGITCYNSVAESSVIRTVINLALNPSERETNLEYCLSLRSCPNFRLT